MFVTQSGDGEWGGASRGYMGRRDPASFVGVAQAGPGCPALAKWLLARDVFPSNPAFSASDFEMMLHHFECT